MATIEQPQVTPAGNEDRTVVEEEAVRLFVGREDGEWVAIAVDYTIVGTGPTEEAATERVAELLCSYLSSCIADGIRTLAEAKRPISLRWRLRLRRRVLIGKWIGVVRKAGVTAHTKSVVLPSQFDRCLSA